MSDSILELRWKVHIRQNEQARENVVNAQNALVQFQTSVDGRRKKTNYEAEHGKEDRDKLTAFVNEMLRSQRAYEKTQNGLLAFEAKILQLNVDSLLKGIEVEPVRPPEPEPKNESVPTMVFPDGQVIVGSGYDRASSRQAKKTAEKIGKEFAKNSQQQDDIPSRQQKRKSKT